MNLQVNGRTKTIHGSVLVTLADTLAAHQLGGFKVGVGFALRKCRVCFATFEDMQTKVFILHAQCVDVSEFKITHAYMLALEEHI